jgi:PEGA domain
VRREIVRNNSVAIMLLAICPLLASQQPQPVPEPPAPAPQAAPSAPPPPHTLLDGTPIKLRLSETISSANARVNQEVPFAVVEDISVDNVIVIPKGSTAIGTVTEAEPRRSMGRGGKLNVSISYVRLKDQEKAALRAIQNNKGGGHVGAMTVGMVGTAIVFFPAAPLLLFVHGKDITIPQGTEITAFVEGDMHLDMAKFVDAPAAPASAQALAPPAAAAQATLAIESTPSGADVEIDGEFVGNTPSTITVAPGSHQIAVKKKGYADWGKTMNITGGTIHLNAELEQVQSQQPVAVPPPPPPMN